MGKSKIPWCTDTWDPAVGCTPVSDGCTNCWARTLHNQRHLAWKRGRWPTAPPQYHEPFGKVQLLPDRLDQPLRWRKPRRIFVCSQSDLFHEDVPDGFIDEVFSTIGSCGVLGEERSREHIFLVLTKRPKRMRDYMMHKLLAFSGQVKDALGAPDCFLLKPLRNVWLGVSVEDQATADDRIPLLLETPAAKRFVSVEPMLGPVALTLYVPEQEPHRCPSDVTLDWVICGGDSGPKHRSMELSWAESLYAECAAARVPWFGKQRAATRPGQPLPGKLGDREMPQ